MPKLNYEQREWLKLLRRRRDYLEGQLAFRNDQGPSTIGSLKSTRPCAGSSATSSAHLRTEAGREMAERKAGTRRARSSAPSAQSANGHVELGLADRAAAKSPLVGQIMAFVRRFIVITDEQLLVVALWTIHTHCFDLFDQTPYLAITSPEKQCGKTRLLELLETLAANSWNVDGSEAVLFRTIDADKPTLIWDEVDTIFNPSQARFNEDRRAILNKGNRPGSKVARCADFGSKVVEFEVFCPKALAAIGVLPDTVADRSIPIRMERKAKTDEVERGRTRVVRAAGAPVADQIVAWLDDKRRKRLARATPRLPDELDDRAQDGCECLLAIADEAGCGAEAREALVTLYTGERLDELGSMRTRLLRDLRDIWLAREQERGRMVRSISTQTLLAELHSLEESDWRRYYGRSLEAPDMAKLLAHYGVKSTRVKVIRNGKPQSPKGYQRDDLFRAFRYLE